MKLLSKILFFITTMLAGVLCITTCYFALELDNTRVNLEQTQSELTTTKEELDSTRQELNSVQIDFDNLNENFVLQKQENDNLHEHINVLNRDLESVQKTLSDLKSDEYELVYVGDYKVTYYCDERYSHICGGNGVTASGKPTEVGWTAAADFSVLPNGTTIYIEGIGFREIQDVGGGVNGSHIDVLVETHNDALSLGTSSNGVWVLVKNNT